MIGEVRTAAFAEGGGGFGGREGVVEEREEGMEIRGMGTGIRGENGRGRV